MYFLPATLLRGQTDGKTYLRLTFQGYYGSGLEHGVHIGENGDVPRHQDRSKGDPVRHAIHIRTTPQRKSEGVVGRAAAMVAEPASDISHAICHNCREKEHWKSDCPAFANNKERRTSNDGRQGKYKVEPGSPAGQKWCSFHNSIIHNGADCRAQGKPRQRLSGSYSAIAVLSATSLGGIREDWDFDCVHDRAQDRLCS